MKRRVDILAVIGTRPEAVKMFPVVRELRRRHAKFRVRICATAQHRGLLDTMLRAFRLVPEIDLDLMRPDQTPNAVLSGVVGGMESVLSRSRPDLVLVQGDTTSALGAALAAFHKGVPIGHVEAGLRTLDLAGPFPEEANRQIIDRLSGLHFAPTESARSHLLREGIAASGIFVTGNTAIDALLWAARHPAPFEDPALRALPHGPLAVVTLHRREVFGAPLREIFAALVEAAGLFPGLRWVYPVHPNPHVRAAARAALRHQRIHLVDPLCYLDFVRLMKRCSFIVTDSGGIQEEAPSLGKPVLVVREKTERAEFLGKGTRLVGVSGAGLVAAIRRVVDSPPPPSAFRRNPFGDGRAAPRIVAAIARRFGL